MDYQKLYNNIIENAKLLNRVKSIDNYYEIHHILPKCLGGTNDEKNLVILTAREHFLCHKILTYIYPCNSKIMFGFQMMVYTHKNSRNLKLSSRDYAYLKYLRFSNGVSEETKQKMRNAERKEMSDDSRLNISKGLDLYYNSSEMLEKKRLKLQEREQKIANKELKKKLNRAKFKESEQKRIIKKLKKEAKLLEISLHIK